MGAYTGFAQVTADALDYALNAFDITDNNLRRKLLDLYQTLDTYPEVPASLEKLRRAGLTIGVLSNGETGMIERAARAAEIRDSLEHILSADSVGVFKPHERVYQLAVDRLGLSPQRICFVSANAWDVAGAAHFGYTVVWVNRFDQTPENLPGVPVDRIGSLDDLSSLLRDCRE
jgi:2-haloacid dehalogenase